MRAVVDEYSCQRSESGRIVAGTTIVICLARIENRKVHLSVMPGKDGLVDREPCKVDPEADFSYDYENL